MAADGAPIVDGKIVWDIVEPENLELWYRLGEAAEAAGLEWGGRWSKLRDFPHVQKPGVSWQTLILNGAIT